MIFGLYNNVAYTLHTPPLLPSLYVSICHLLAYGSHLHDLIISLLLNCWVNKTSLTPPLFIEMSVHNVEVISHVCTCSGYPLWLCFYDFLIRFINYSDGMVLFGFHFLVLHSCLLFILLELLMVFFNFGGCGAASMPIYSVIAYREQRIVWGFTGQFYISVPAFPHHKVV